jgi:transcriptional regulator NrdR family protein
MNKTVEDTAAIPTREAAASTCPVKNQAIKKVSEADTARHVKDFAAVFKNFESIEPFSFSLTRQI